MHSHHEAEGKGRAGTQAQGVCPFRTDGGFIVFSSYAVEPFGTCDCWVTRDGGVITWGSHQGTSNTTAGSISGTNHAQGTRTCGVSTLFR